METKENGVTLVALVTTIVLLFILASIGVTVGTSTLDSVAFTQFKSELKVMQNKVNELNQSTEKNRGTDLSEEQKNILNIEVISNIIYKDVSETEKEDIKNGFRYFDSKYIQDNLELNSVKRDYLINVEYRYIIFPDGFEYEGITYYMIDQIENEIYNVRYNDKNEKTGSFDVNITSENNKFKVDITNIVYKGYVDKWQVKYKLDGTSYWETSNDLTFYLRDEGTYDIKVIHGDEIDLGSKSVRILNDGLITDKVRNGIIKIGDYVQYIPDTVNQIDTAYTDLISDLGTYSGSTVNSQSTLTQETSLKWRVLDVVDGKVRLISEVPTTSTIALSGYNGYNNAVYLLDKTCSTLYNNSTYAEKVQNLKIEDIQDYMNETDYSKITTKYNSTISPTKKYYPSILEQEKNQTMAVSEEETQQTGTFGLSEQNEPILQTTTKQATSWILKYTYWDKLMEESDFSNPKYNELFIRNKSGNNYPVYWISSRCVITYSGDASFCVRRVDSGYVRANCLYNSVDATYGKAFCFRPVITLKSNIEINSTESEDPLEAYVLK